MDDLKIGEIVKCINNTCDRYEGDERLIIGENYSIKDIDFHFPNKICVKLKGPYYYHREFVPQELFSKISYIREEKINKILKPQNIFCRIFNKKKNYE